MERKRCGDCIFYHGIYDDCGVCTLCETDETFDKTCDFVYSCKKFQPKQPETLFDRITSSPEVLAEKLVYQRNCKMIHQNDKCTIGYWTFSWKSSVIKGQSFETREEAIAATVAKLKEVVK